MDDRRLRDCVRKGDEPWTGGFRSFADVASGGRDATDEEQAVIDFVREVAADYAAGRMALDGVRRETTARERAVCARFACRAWQDWPELWAMLDDLIATSIGPRGELVYRTRFGYVSSADLRGVPVRYERTPGGVEIVFTEAA